VDARTPTIFCLRTHRLIDVMRRGETAATALGRLAEYGPDLVVLPLEDAQSRYESRFKSEPVAITEAAWHDALNVLPPYGWRNTAAGESFKSIERTAGSVTAIYVRICNRHYSFSDDIHTPHDACLRRVAQSRAYRGDADSRGGDR